MIRLKPRSAFFRVGMVRYIGIVFSLVLPILSDVGGKTIYNIALIAIGLVREELTLNGEYPKIQLLDRDVTDNRDGILFAIGEHFRPIQQ